MVTGDVGSRRSAHQLRQERRRLARAALVAPLDTLLLALVLIWFVAGWPPGPPAGVFGIKTLDITWPTRALDPSIGVAGAVGLAALATGIFLPTAFLTTTGTESVAMQAKIMTTDAVSFAVSGLCAIGAWVVAFEMWAPTGGAPLASGVGLGCACFCSVLMALSQDKGGAVRLRADQLRDQRRRMASDPGIPAMTATRSPAPGWRATWRGFPWAAAVKMGLVSGAVLLGRLVLDGTDGRVGVASGVRAS